MEGNRSVQHDAVFTGEYAIILFIDHLDDYLERSGSLARRSQQADCLVYSAFNSKYSWYLGDHLSCLFQKEKA